MHACYDMRHDRVFDVCVASTEQGFFQDNDYGCKWYHRGIRLGV